MRIAPFLLLLAAGCGSELREEAQKSSVDVPTPSGPPIAQQADAVPTTAHPLNHARWEAVEGAGPLTLRLMSADGGMLMSMTCPQRGQMKVTVPSLSAIGSEDRFSLALGDEPVTLVADPTRQEKQGVSAVGAAPEGKLIREAKSVAALYGTQKMGPAPAPPEALRDKLAKACA